MYCIAAKWKRLGTWRRHSTKYMAPRLDLSHTAPREPDDRIRQQPTNTKARYQVDEKRKKLTGMDPNVAAAGRTNLKYMPMTPEIRPVAKSSRRGPINRNVQSKHNPTHT